MVASIDYFKEIWCVVFEFGAGRGERPVPVCLVALELRTGRLVRQWLDEFGATPPYDIGRDALFVAYYASAELGCHLALGWPMPTHVLDLCAEFKNQFSGITLPAGKGLLGALIHFGLDAIGAAQKDEMRKLAISIGACASYTDEQRLELLDYCQTDVVALARVFPLMTPSIDLPQALLRGCYMPACAQIERNGVPNDVEMLEKFRRYWPNIIDHLISEIDADFDVFEGGTFKQEKFAAYLARTGTAWPRLASGALDLRDDTFKDIAKKNPEIATLRELRTSLAKMRLNTLEVGHDGRNRTLLGAFGSKTGRNQPSNSKFIFGPSTWMRGLIKPPPGYGVAYIDWSQQEFGIAASLSGDATMMGDYLSGDPYLAFAKTAGAIPPWGTKDTHPKVREQYKTAALGVQYGLEEKGLADRLDIQPVAARRLLQAHRLAYRTFWEWSGGAVTRAMVMGELNTVFGWKVHPAPPPDKPSEPPNERSLANFPMQANGAEMLRLACIRGIEIGIEICAPVHDAILIAAPLDRLELDVARMQEVMEQASRAVLGGFTLRSDAAAIVRYPDRYMDKRGKAMWERVVRLIEEREREPGAKCQAHAAKLSGQHPPGTYTILSPVL
jgi:DNA polymerase-1